MKLPTDEQLETMTQFELISRLFGNSRGNHQDIGAGFPQNHKSECPGPRIPKEPISLVKELISVVQVVKQLQARVSHLEAELAQYRPPPPTSRNSSQPPSRDDKANLPGRKRKRIGAKPGYERAIRELVAEPVK